MEDQLNLEILYGISRRFAALWFKKGQREVEKTYRVEMLRLHPIPRPVSLDITVLLPMALPSSTPFASTCQKAAFEGWLQPKVQTYCRCWMFEFFPKTKVTQQDETGARSTAECETSFKGFGLHDVMSFVIIHPAMYHALAAAHVTSMPQSFLVWSTYRVISYITFIICTFQKYDAKTKTLVAFIIDTEPW